MLPVDFKNDHVPCHYICNFRVNFPMSNLEYPMSPPPPVNIGSMLHVNLKKYPCSHFEYRGQERRWAARHPKVIPGTSYALQSPGLPASSQSEACLHLVFGLLLLRVVVGWVQSLGLQY